MTSRLRWGATAIAATLLSLAPARAADRWIRMPSTTGFEVYSSASEGDTRRVLQHFERVSDFFAQAFQAKPKKSEPVRILVFGSKKEYEQYRPNQIAAAFYLPGPARDYIVLGGATDDVFPIAVHEYVHLIVQNSGMKFPPWLSEGIAEVYATLKPMGDQVLVGNLIPGRRIAILSEKWTPLSTILAAGHDSPYYNEKNKAGSLYNEGWALTHMLALSPAYANDFAKVAVAINAGTASEAAIEKVYGKPLAQVEKELQGYIRGDSFQGRIFKGRLKSSSDKAAGEPLAPFDLKLALLDLTDRPGKEAESRKTLEALASEDPQRPEPHVSLGYLAWRARDNKEASAHFARALELGSRNPAFLYDYGRVAVSADPPGAMRALSLLLEAEPDRRDARLMLAEAQLSARDSKGARETLSPIRSISAEDAARFFRMQAYASADLGDLAGARSALERWKQNAKNQDDLTGADQIQAYLDRAERANAQAGAPVAGGLSGAPIPAAPITPIAPGETRAEVGGRPAASLFSYTGVLVDMQCEGGVSRIIVQRGDEKAAFLMTDPEQVIGLGIKDRKVVDLVCGKQKPVQVTLRYERAPPDSGVLGSVKTITFQSEPGAVPEDLTASAADPPKPVARPYSLGTFVELDCTALPPKMILQAGKERTGFLVDSVDRMFVYGLPDGKGIEMSCGPQKNPPEIWIEYDPPSATQRGVRGLARAIHFEAPPASGLKTR